MDHVCRDPVIGALNRRVVLKSCDVVSDPAQPTAHGTRQLREIKLILVIPNRPCTSGCWGPSDMASQSSDSLASGGQLTSRVGCLSIRYVDWHAFRWPGHLTSLDYSRKRAASQPARYYAYYAYREGTDADDTTVALWRCSSSLSLPSVIRDRAESLNFASLPACSAAGYSNIIN